MENNEELKGDHLGKPPPDMGDQTTSAPPKKESPIVSNSD